MGFKNNCYCTIWENRQTKKVVNFADHMAIVRITISTKNKRTGYYDNDFGKDVRFAGKAFEKLSDVNMPELKEKDRLHLLEVEVKTRKGRDDKFYDNFICWDFERATWGDDGDKQPEVVPTAKAEKPYTPIESLDDLPF